jgi:hypothetical protein
MVELQRRVIAVVAAQLAFLSFESDQFNLSLATSDLLRVIRLKSIVSVVILAP